MVTPFYFELGLVGYLALFITFKVATFWQHNFRYIYIGGQNKGVFFIHPIYYIHIII